LNSKGHVTWSNDGVPSLTHRVATMVQVKPGASIAI
jgi:Flp pilus assembly secretin CpaC